jgi:DNA-binding NarL/FixJ family response regulator
MESSTLPVGPADGAIARRGRRAERLLVLMDDSLLRAVVLAALEAAPTLELAAVTGSEAEAIATLTEQRLDIVLVDGDGDRLPAVVHRVEALASASAAKVVCFVSSGDVRRIGALLQAGAESCVATSVAPDDLAAVIREAGRGTIFHAPPTPPGSVVAEANGHAPTVAGLTSRELEVLALAAEGLANKQIAQRLWVTPKTIKFHLSNVFRKLDVANRTEATHQAQLLGLLQAGGSGAAD